MDIPNGSLRFGPVGFLDDFLRLPIVCSERVRRVARDKVALFASWAFPLSVTSAPRTSLLRLSMATSCVVVQPRLHPREFHLRRYWQVCKVNYQSAPSGHS